MGFKKDVIKGVSWMGGLRFVTRSLALMKFIILARFLTPSQFGLYGVAMLVLGLVEIITETGINIFLIQRKDIDEYIDTAWIISICRGFFIALSIFLLSDVIAKLFMIPSATNIIRLSSVIPLIKGFINPSEVKFQKELLFNKEFYFRSLLFLTDFVFAISIGVVTRSEYAFVLAMIISAALEVVVSQYAILPRPRFNFDMLKAKLIVREGKWVTFAGTFEYLFQHLDDIVVGRILGPYSLGLYQQAYRISTMPISESEQVISRVTLPVYTSIALDTKRLRSSFVRVTLVIASFVVPFGLILVLFANEIVSFLFGKEWQGAVPALRVLAVFGILKAISNSGYPLFLSLRKQRIVTIVTFVGILGLAIPLYPLVNIFGIVGAAYSTIIGAVASILAATYFSHRVLSK